MTQEELMNARKNELIKKQTSKNIAEKPILTGRNPAAVYAQKRGYSYEIVTDAAGNQSGVVTLPTGQKIEEWDLYRNRLSKERNISPIPMILKSTNNYNRNNEKRYTQQQNLKNTQLKAQQQFHILSQNKNISKTKPKRLLEFGFGGV